MPQPGQLKVDTDALATKRTSTPPPLSALISVPTSWSPMDRPSLELSPKDSSTETFWRGNDLEVPPAEPPLPLSATSSSSSSNPIFSWPLTSSSSAPLARPDPFDTTRSFSEDPFGRQSSSSSSGDDSWQPESAAEPLLNHSQISQPAEMSPLPLHRAALERPADTADVQTNTLTRTYASPSGDGGLQHPNPHPRPAPNSAQFDPWNALSLELVDSLQSAIQTLLYVAPPHLLDNAKEQYSGCAIQVPATSISALLTSMRGLNYLSSNLAPISQGQVGNSRTIEDFDIGELLQNVADQLSGETAHAEVDLVLFHGDVGIKHISTTGDREGLAYVLGHILRQVLLVANKGDTIELGLQVIPQSPSAARRISLPSGHIDIDSRSDSGDDGSPRLLCVFEIIHNVSQSFDNVATPRAELNPFTRLEEQKAAATPKLDTPLCYRLLRQANAWLKTNTVPSSPSGFGLPRFAYEVSAILPRGKPIAEPKMLTDEEEATRQPFSGLLLPREPTLVELADFAETLRGRKVNLHASLTSIFARHLTSYLAAWGADVSHIPNEDDTAQTVEPPGSPKFIIIDEDLAVLRRELLRLKPDTPPVTMRQRSLKRPGLFRGTKSTQQIRQVTGTVIIHFTSIDKYHQVRDIVSTFASAIQPDVVVVPKPVGPRRFITALFTAAKQPLVDPAFSPIATSPRSPVVTSGNRTPTGTLHEGFFDAVDILQADATPQMIHSPLGEFPPAVPAVSTAAPIRTTDAQRMPLTPADIVATPAAEYFSRAASGKATSGASGIVMQSPDGRPFGMFFEPRASGRTTSGTFARNDGVGPRAKPISRTASTESDVPPAVAISSESPQSSRRTSGMSLASEVADDTSGDVEPEQAPRSTARRKTLPTPTSKPIVVQGRDRSSTITRRVISEADSRAVVDKPLPDIAETKASRPSKASDVVVPPINVLIVEDNPINQNILSMFFRKKKIKHQTAKDGLEAVEKWRTGGFHLILMDIQLPVMDGIEATKEIRKLEKSNNIGMLPSTPAAGDHSRSIDSLIATPASSPFRSAVIIVALTASSLQSDRVAALTAGCNDFLTKPVSLKWLEKKTVEWGCMQALIDFDGWRRWKGNDSRDPAETKRGFQTGPEAAARAVASRLRIERSKGRRGPSKPGSPSHLSASARASPSVSPGAVTVPLPVPTVAISSPTPEIASSTVPSQADESEVERPSEKPLPALPVD